MIAYVRGLLDHKEPGRVVVDIGGIGYEVFIPLSTYQKLPAVGDQVKLFTHHHVREDVMDLYGFLSSEEKEIFEMVLTISGVGTKVALSILSAMSADVFRRSIAQGDIKTLTKIPGIGKKSAERMVLELKGKIGTVHIDEGMMRVLGAESGNDAVAALLSLGAGQSAAEYAVYRAERLLGDEAEIEDLIAQAIKLLSS
ncbi:Holliday junction branch migration protein RuvA [Candidatus Poribacteria bacterium]